MLRSFRLAWRLGENKTRTGQYTRGTFCEQDNSIRPPQYVYAYSSETL